jgi:hypothetical protein
MNYINTIKKYVSGKKYASSNVRSADGTIAYITATGVSKMYPSEDVYNATAGKNNCASDFIQLTPNWSDLGFPVGSVMETGQSCGNENSYVQSAPPETNFDWQYYAQSNPDLGITTETQATDHWNSTGKYNGLLPNASILTSMGTLGKVGYVDVNSNLHLVPPSYTGKYASYTARSNVTGTNMVDCTRPIPPIRYGDQLTLSFQNQSGSVNSSSLLEFGSTTTNLFLRSDTSLQGQPVKYGDSLSITTSTSNYTSDCGWWGCKVGRVNTDTMQLEFGPGGETAYTFLVFPPEGSKQGGTIKYGDPILFVAIITPNNSTLNQDVSLYQGNSIKSQNGQYMFIYQTDGNVCLYNTSGGGSIWCSMKLHTPGKLVMQGDGNLVAYDSGGIPQWSTGTAGQGEGPYKLIMQNDRNVVLMDSQDTVLWNTQTTTTNTVPNQMFVGVACVDESTVKFKTYEQSKNSNVFSFQPQTMTPNTCNLDELKKTCDTSDCTGFLHSPADNTWQMITSVTTESDYKIAHTMQDMYLKKSTIDLNDASCRKGNPEFIDSELFANYVDGNDFINGGTSQCSVIEPPKPPQNYKRNQKKMLQKGKQYIDKYNQIKVQDVQTQNVQTQQDMELKTKEYQDVLGSIEKTKRSTTLEQQNEDLSVFDAYNKNRAIVWGLIATTIFLIIVFRPR